MRRLSILSKILALILIVLLSMSLVGCQPTNGGDTGDTGDTGNNGGNNGGGGNGEVVVDDELQIHFYDIGHKDTGDSFYIKAGDVDILVDAGSNYGSVTAIDAYLKKYVTDGVLEYAIASHAHMDHIAAYAGGAGFKSIFDLYEVETIIDFAQAKSNSDVYNNYKQKRDAEVAAGATHYNALQCWNNQDGASRIIELTPTIYLEILYTRYYEKSSTDSDNDNSLCFRLLHNDKAYLFTGDLSKSGESSLASSNSWDTPVALYKAGHHGSKYSSTATLMQKVKPQRVVVTAQAGSKQYKNQYYPEGQFPTQEAIDNIAVYTDQVYVTRESIDYSSGTWKAMNGLIIVTSNQDGVTVDCSNGNTLLKDQAWFKKYRTTPVQWQDGYVYA